MIAKRLKGIALQLAHHRLTRSYGIRLLAAQREEGQFNSESWVVRARIQDAKPILQWSWSFFHAASQVDLVYMHAHARTHVHSMLPLMCGAVSMAWQLLAISVGVVNPRMATEIWTYLISMVIGATL